MKKFLKIAFVLIVVVIVVVIASVAILYKTQLSNIVTTTVHEMGPKLTQSDVNLESFKLSLISGQATLEGFTVGNPEGYKTPTAIELGKLYVDLEPKSLMGDTIHVEEILIDSPVITMEMGLGESNIGKIQKNIEAFTGKKGGEEKEEPAADKPAKKVIIDNLYVKNGTIKLSAKILGGKSLDVALPEIHLADIGKKEPATVLEVVKEITGVLTKAITGAATGALKGTVELGEEAVEAVGNAVKGTAEAATDTLKGTAGTATQAAEEGAKAVGDAAKEVSEAATEGVKDVVGGLKGLIPGKKKE